MVFFFKQKTAYEMRISDWSSDVCSSDLLPYTVALVLSAIGWATLVGILLGCFSAIRRNSLADKLIAVLSVSFIAIPYFVISIYTLLIFAVMLQWFPAIGVRSEEHTSELQSLMRISYAVFCLNKKTQIQHIQQEILNI